MTTQELLRTFCAKDDIREFLCAPMRKGNHLYASDGCVLVRVDDDPSVSAVPVPDNVNVTGLLATCDHNVAAMRPLGAVLPDPIPCDRCAGTGLVAKMIATRRCEYCDDGVFRHGTNTYQCQDCDGTGYEETPHATDNQTCPKCDGEKTDRNQTVTIGIGYFARHYIAKLQTLPNIQMWTHPNDPKAMAAFSFDGGMGVLMPCLRPR